MREHVPNVLIRPEPQAAHGIFFTIIFIFMFILVHMLQPICANGLHVCGLLVASGNVHLCEVHHTGTSMKRARVCNIPRMC